MITALKRMFTPKQVDCSCVIVVYKSKNGSWRGFAHPYDVTTEASTKERAFTAVEEMVEAYADALKKYDFPKHLTNKPLSDGEDRDKFNELALDFLFKQGHLEGPDYYAKTKTLVAC